VKRAYIRGRGWVYKFKLRGLVLVWLVPLLLSLLTGALVLGSIVHASQQLVASHQQVLQRRLLQQTLRPMVWEVSKDVPYLTECPDLNPFYLPFKGVILEYETIKIELFRCGDSGIWIKWHRF
jgi:hypothetical protein